MTAIQRSRDYGYGYRDPSIRVTAIPQADLASRSPKSRVIRAIEPQRESGRVSCRTRRAERRGSRAAGKQRAGYVQSDLRVGALRA